MTPGELIERLRTQGIRIHSVGDRIRVSGPAGILTDEVRAELEAHKSEILHLLPTLPLLQTTATVQHLLRDDFRVEVEQRFASCGTTPISDDFEIAVDLEGRLSWWRETLDAVYRGEMTLGLLSSGEIVSHQRILAS